MQDSELKKVFVVKVQVPIFPPEATDVLVYDKKRSFQQMLPMDENIRAAMKGRYKAFFRGGFSKDGKTFYLGTESEVADPGW